MTINSRLRNLERSLRYREMALLWLKTAQARSGYSEYWKVAEFQPWASENEEAGLLYSLVFEVNGAVIAAAEACRERASWAGLLGISMIATSPQSKPFELGAAGDFLELWREKLCTMFADVVALERAVELICEGHFDGHDVLFADSRKALTSSYEAAKFLIVGYLERSPGSKVTQFLNEWVMLSRSKVLVARGEIFEARDEVLTLLKMDHPGSGY
jgi:hypothetical protein